MDDLYQDLRGAYSEFRISTPKGWIKYRYYRGKLEKAIEEIGNNDPKLMQVYENAKSSMEKGFTRELGNGQVEGEVSLDGAPQAYQRLIHDHNLLVFFRAIEHRIEWVLADEEAILEKIPVKKKKS